jgi:hypothetical protein
MPSSTSSASPEVSRQTAATLRQRYVRLIEAELQSVRREFRASNDPDRERSLWKRIQRLTDKIAKLPE